MGKKNSFRYGNGEKTVSGMSMGKKSFGFLLKNDGDKNLWTLYVNIKSIPSVQNTWKLSAFFEIVFA